MTVKCQFGLNGSFDDCDFFQRVRADKEVQKDLFARRQKCKDHQANNDN
jgi:hypothetical protein